MLAVVAMMLMLVAVVAVLAIVAVVAIRDMRADGFFSDGLQQHRGVQIANKLECSRATCRAPVGVIYGASIVPYKLDSTRAWHSKFSKKRGRPTQLCVF